MGRGSVKEVGRGSVKEVGRGSVKEVGRGGVTWGGGQLRGEGVELKILTGLSTDMVAILVRTTDSTSLN